MNKLEEMRTRLGMTREDMADIIAVYVAASQIGDDSITYVADKVPAVLNKYEQEILRQQEVITRLQQKNRNYRSGMKQLQRAHEASLHREDTLKDTVEQYRQLLVEALASGPSCQVFEPGELDEPVLYSPVRFNKEPTEQWNVPVSNQHVEYSR